MTGKSRIKYILLCTILTVLYVSGCGMAEGNPGTGETAGENEVLTANGDESMADEIVPEQGESSYMPEDGEENVVKDAETETTSDRLALSILGDSISTYDGYIPEGFAVFYPLNGEIKDVSQTWWMKLLDDTGMELCRNDSSSGSTCVGDSLSIDDPKYGCSGLRTSLLVGEQGRIPDFIIVYMGTNDLMTGVPIGDNDGTQTVEEGVVDNFSDAYCLILDKIANNYPAARIYCCTLPPIGDWGTSQPFVTFVNHIGLTSEDYSECIRVIADNKGVSLIELSDCGIEIDNLHEMTSDGVHLTPVGMECVERAVLGGLGFTPDQ